MKIFTKLVMLLIVGLLSSHTALARESVTNAHIMLIETDQNGNVFIELDPQSFVPGSNPCGGNSTSRAIFVIPASHVTGTSTQDKLWKAAYASLLAAHLGKGDQGVRLVDLFLTPQNLRPRTTNQRI